MQEFISSNGHLSNVYITVNCHKNMFTKWFIMFHSNVTLFAQLLKVIVCKTFAQVHLENILICINLENLNVEFVALSLIFQTNF